MYDSHHFLIHCRIIVGRLFMVDLAGSERMKKSGMLPFVTWKLIACVLKVTFLQSSTDRSPRFACKRSEKCQPLLDSARWVNILFTIFSREFSVFGLMRICCIIAGKCINARADPSATHVPFRDSKLTRLLQESLGGECARGA